LPVTCGFVAVLARYRSFLKRRKSIRVPRGQVDCLSKLGLSGAAAPPFVHYDNLPVITIWCSVVVSFMQRADCASVIRRLEALTGLLFGAVTLA